MSIKLITCQNKLIADQKMIDYSGQSPHNIATALRRADIPAAKEPAGFGPHGWQETIRSHSDPVAGGRCLSWDVTIVDTLAVSYVTQCASSTGAAAEAAAARKHVKYAGIAFTHIFVPVAVESIGPLGHEASEFLTDLATGIISDHRQAPSQMIWDGACR